MRFQITIKSKIINSEVILVVLLALFSFGQMIEFEPLFLVVVTT